MCMNNNQKIYPKFSAGNSRFDEPPKMYGDQLEVQGG